MIDSTIARLRWYADKGREYRNWYSRSSASIIAYCHESGLNPDSFIDVLALVSPRCKVQRSITRAIEYCSTGMLPRDVPISIRQSVSHWECTGEIRGPKTSAFSRALKGDKNAVVLDVWICRAIGCPHELITRKANWAMGDKLIRSVAFLLRWPPREAQAAIWSGIVLENRLSVPILEIGSVHNVQAI